MINTDTKPYPHDWLVNRLILWLIPQRIKPNHITSLRFVLTVPTVWLIYSGNYSLGAALFIIAALTDIIDGSLARIRNQITEWGELFDPVADKLLIGLVGIILIFQFLHWAFIAAILALEIITILGAFYFKLTNKPIHIKSNIFGKIKMILQSIGIVLLFVFAQMPNNEPLNIFVSTIFAISIVFTLLSMFFAGI